MDPQETPFLPIDEAGGLVFLTTLPGSKADFPDERNGPTAERFWGLLDEARDAARDETRAAATDADRPIWVHLDRTKPRASRWVREQSGVAEIVGDALLAEETRPRAVERDGGLLVILRGVNLNQGAEPDELIVIRMWFERGRAVTLRQSRFMTVRRLRAAAEQGAGPATPADLLVAIAEGVTDRLGPAVENLQNMLDETEDRLAGEDPRTIDTHEIAEVRRQAIRLRRFLAPQRDALLALASSGSPLLDETHRAEFHEIAQRTARFVEDLEEVRDRAAVSQEELRAARERQANKTMYLLTLVAAIALPLGLITGLLGVNVGGIPGVDDPMAFWIVTLGMVVIAGALVGIFKWLKWL